jgi:DNA invertase Pin-like site-specific DNA recombinase
MEYIDTTSPGGKLFFYIIGVLTESERNIIVERTKAGLFRCTRKRATRRKAVEAQQSVIRRKTLGSKGGFS